MIDKHSVYSHLEPARPPSELAAERRAQIAAEQAEIQERKQRDLIRQTSTETTPETRVALWERRHGLGLPRSPEHPLLQFVASSTGLTMEQVLEEQQRRAQRRATS